MRGPMLVTGASARLPRRSSGPLGPAPRDPRQLLVEWSARVGPVTAHALSIRERASPSAAAARLAAAERAGLMHSSRPLTGWPALYAPTRDGLRVCGRNERAPSAVGAGQARHAALCAAVAAVLERSYPGCLLVGERELVRIERAAAARLASTRIGRGAAHRPDLALWPTSTDTCAALAVEVELTVKSPRRLKAICAGWSAAVHLAGVIYAVEPAVRPALERALHHGGHARNILIVDLRQTLARATPERDVSSVA